MHNERKTDWKDNWKILYGSIFAISIIALILGYVIEHNKLLLGVLKFLVPQPERFEKTNALLGHLFDEIGIAGLIACGLAVTIERLSAKEFIKLANDERAAIINQSQQLAADERQKIKEDVFYYVFGHDIPKEIRNEITTQILKEVFIRKNLSMVYTLKPVEDIATHSKYVLVELEMRYDIVNLTSERKAFTLANGLKKSPVASLADQTKFISVSAQGCENPLTLTGAQIPIKSVRDSYSLNIEEPVWVKPNNFTRVTICSQTIKHFTSGSFFIFDYHTCDLDLSVHVLDRTLQIHTSTFAGDWFKETPKHKPSNGFYNWELKRPLLAHQGIFITWIPEELENLNAPSTDTVAKETSVESKAATH